MASFTATNGYSVRFKCRYKDQTYYEISEPRSFHGQELAVKDDGTMHLTGADSIPPAWLVAFSEFRQHEQAAYERWRADFEKRCNLTNKEA
jgi:hypothetical protein